MNIFRNNYIIKNIFGKLTRKEENSLADAVVETEEYTLGTTYPQSFRKRIIHLIKLRTVYIGGLALVSASFIGNILNFFYNSYLGRVLGFEHFALIGLMSALLSFASIFFGSFSTTANYKCAFLIGKYGNEAGYQFWKYIRIRVMYMSIIVTILWLLLMPFLMNFFDARVPLLFILFGVILLTGFANGADRGFISAKFKFGSLAVINIFDPIIRILTAVILVFLSLKFYSFSAIPLAIFGTFLIGWWMIIRRKDDGPTTAPVKEIRDFPFKFFMASMLTGFSSIAFSTFDILLANHYLEATQAGEYTLLSLVGKMVYFMGGLTTPFIIPLISRIEGANKNSKHTMYILVISTGLLALFGFICFGLFGFISLPILYGQKAKAILAYASIFAFGMMCYTISKVFINYYLVRKIYTFTIGTSLLVFLQLLLIVLNHSSFGAIAVSMCFVWIIHLGLSVILHLNIETVKKIERKFPNIFILFQTKGEFLK